MTNTLDWYADLDLLEKQELLEGFVNEDKDRWYLFLLDTNSPNTRSLISALHIGCPKGFAILIKSPHAVAYCTGCSKNFDEEVVEEWLATIDSVDKSLILDKFTELHYYEWLDFLEYNRKAAEDEDSFLDANQEAVERSGKAESEAEYDAMIEEEMSRQEYEKAMYAEAMRELERM